MILSRHRGLRGIELALFKFDPIDMQVGSWEIVAAKIIAKLFGLNIILASVEISDSRATVGLLNCFLSVFWG